MYDKEIQLLEDLKTRFLKKGRESNCLTVKEACNIAINEFNDIIKEMRRADEAARISGNVSEVSDKGNQ